ncbi:PHP domain-containing protein [Paenibacillus sp. GCM10023250]|uniref:PHP domain-containing protein n=1 Tax=Paenibacillus sp. GCM10023250 TaxID=3252648 RepID=UPI00360AC700
MRDIILIDRNQPAYKGNLHLHTTWSDGRLPAAEVVEAFKAKGYHFISISDHDVYTRTDEFNTADFITLPGTSRRRRSCRAAGSGRGSRRCARSTERS